MERLDLKTESGVLDYRAGNARLAEDDDKTKDMTRIIRGVNGFS